MAKYTTLVRSICEQKAGLNESKGFNNVDGILDDSWNKIFTTQCTFFDETYREVICKKILKHYYMREIGAETVGLWQLWLNTKLEEIMPYYNQLYESALITYNPLYNIDLHRTKYSTGAEQGSQNDTIQDAHNTTNTLAEMGGRTSSVDISGTHADTGTRSANGSSNEITANDETHADIDTVQKSDAYSDTPQGSLSNVDNNAYLTNYRKIQEGDTNSGSKNIDIATSKTDSDSESTNTYGSYGEDRDTTESNNKSQTKTEAGTNSTIKNRTTGLNTTESYVESVTGANGNYTYSKLINEFRDTFLNIDMMVIGEFKSLFMGLW